MFKWQGKEVGEKSLIKMLEEEESNLKKKQKIRKEDSRFIRYAIDYIKEFPD